MKKRSKKYQESSSLVEKGKEYTLEEGLELVKKTAQANFDAAVETHFNLNIDPKKNQSVRGTAKLPHGTGKKLKIAVLTTPEKQKEAKKAGASLVGGEELIKEIGQTKKANFDVAIASPEMMKKIAPIAKVLGQKGLMPNPKNETINPEPAKVVKELNQGKITFKSDDSGNVHQIIGRISFDDKKLKENFETFLEEIKKAKPKEVKENYFQNIYLTSSMGPSVRIKV
ncbi:MAG: 50S ribosomal protein L1 [Patescibacteria group bacterium]|nr:50S ribosomal protein L1 [Patescibacteria group bacterium]